MVLNVTWVEAAEVDVQRCVQPPVAAQWTGAGPVPLLCFAVIESTLHVCMNVHAC